MKLLCKKCKEQGFCREIFCPIRAKSNAMFKVKLPNQDFLGSSPTPFIGHYGYPYLNVGILSLPETKNAWEYDAPKYWAKNNYQIPEIINFRSALINSRFKARAQDQNKLLTISQEIGMASKPVDIEVNLEQKPVFRVNIDEHLMPTGPNAKLKKAEITSNPKIHTKVEKVYNDTDLKANQALIYLYENNFDENSLAKILTVGTIGLKRNRKLVPTRWGITAVDDAIGKHLIEQIKQYPETDYSAYFGSYLGNYYLILCFPGIWSYELFEIPETKQFMTDYESYEGRKSYAENTAGGYYAARLAILERLAKIKKQGTILALRFITKEYGLPLGVWIVREAARKSANTKPLSFSDKELMLTYAKALIKKKFGFNLDNILKHSIILKNIKNQTKLTNFL